MSIPASLRQTNFPKTGHRLKRLVGGLVFTLLLAVSGHSQSGVAVVNAASFDARFPVSPGSLASAFGSFGTVAEGGAPQLPLQTTLNQIQILINDVAVPLLFVNSTQINFQVPISTPVGRWPIRVVNAGTEVAAGTVDILDTAPGIFFDTVGSLQQGAVLNQDFSPNGEQRPAIKDQVIQIFATGQGPLNAPIPDGEGAPSTNPALTTATPQVFISVDRAVVEFSGMAPGFVGLWQINVRVPNKSYISGLVPIFVVMNGIASNTISVWVAP